jgi:hypothetical protein
MGGILDLAESFWQGQIPPRDMWRPTGKSEELAPGVVFFHTWANVTAIRTEAGLVLVDTGNYTARARTFAAGARWMPVRYAAVAWRTRTTRAGATSRAQAGSALRSSGIATSPFDRYKS